MIPGKKPIVAVDLSGVGMHITCGCRAFIIRTVTDRDAEEGGK